MQTAFELVNLGSEAVGIEWRIRQREVDMRHRGVLTVRLCFEIIEDRTPDSSANRVIYTCLYLWFH